MPPKVIQGLKDEPALLVRVEIAERSLDETAQLALPEGALVPPAKMSLLLHEQNLASLRI
jgi:hypothetical protein